MGKLTIGVLGQSTGTKVETIQYYEKIGLLEPPARTKGGYRSYGAEDLRRLRFIRRTRELGFSIETVRALLSLQDRPQACCDTVDDLVAEQIAAVDAKIASLQGLRDDLSRLAAGCRGGGVISDCRILDALQPAAKV